MSFLEANSKCWWNAALVDATRQLRYKGHVSPGVLMVGGPPCALEVLRAAWARNVLRPPADHAITCLAKRSFGSAIAATAAAATAAAATAAKCSL
ncbi:hypothetical protein HZH66_007671 [Vespula vulgaris]|uniref:Uncharacterized protein n=1 Tax=Vespula vulgaris TaxID=7454 RepID=A0A834JVM2_VESVU|nr:hypothetical protein HZH66_007671 [Vespula vulgaris]